MDRNKEIVKFFVLSSKFLLDELILEWCISRILYSIITIAVIYLEQMLPIVSSSLPV